MLCLVSPLTGGITWQGGGEWCALISWLRCAWNDRIEGEEEMGQVRRGVRIQVTRYTRKRKGMEGDYYPIQPTIALNTPSTPIQQPPISHPPPQSHSTHTTPHLAVFIPLHLHNSFVVSALYTAHFPVYICVWYRLHMHSHVPPRIHIPSPSLTSLNPNH